MKLLCTEICKRKFIMKWIARGNALRISRSARTILLRFFFSLMTEQQELLWIHSACIGSGGQKWKQTNQKSTCKRVKFFETLSLLPNTDKLTEVLPIYTDIFLWRFSVVLRCSLAIPHWNDRQQCSYVQIYEINKLAIENYIKCRTTERAAKIRRRKKKYWKYCPVPLCYDVEQGEYERFNFGALMWLDSVEKVA